ncbi:hypothetical protein [Flavobacterium hungaricum]|uniref:Uncharacterized protein n=1 Tax=Flavobacterium hungaricum TaxID=2082725 RepID=A0ABR9TTI7_9FLAO|nr:hypothetical protein [Flavobacterium hungaricum]MBE8728337.1 hypothetical protein [Flavobacterium hungaricum]
MQLTKKKGCIIILVGFILFFVMMCSTGIAMFKFALKEGGEQNKRDSLRKKEELRFDNLPVIKAALVDTNRIKTPFSKKEANVCFMNFGITTLHHRSRRGKNDISDRRYYVTEYATEFTLFKNREIKLLINGKEYVLKSKRIILTDVNYAREKRRAGNIGSIFSTKEKYDEVLFLEGHEKYREEYKITKEQLDEYLKELNVFCSFRDEYDMINCYYFSRFDSKNTPNDCDLFIENYHLKEIVYNVGDTISFKGKIVNNEVVPLY